VNASMLLAALLASVLARRVPGEAVAARVEPHREPLPASPAGLAGAAGDEP
jgi:hypothetical protein